MGGAKSTPKESTCRMRQLVHMFYADFAYYFGCQFIFYLYEIILKYILYPLPKRHKNTYTLLQMCKKKRDLAGFKRCRELRGWRVFDGFEDCAGRLFEEFESYAGK